MKRILLALALLLLPSAALAQCNGVFPNNTACGNISGAGNLPRPVPLTSFPANAPGGTTGQIQYNAGSGLFGGFTTSGDCTINTTTGVEICTKTNGTAFGPFATSSSPILSSSTITGATTTFTSAQCNTNISRSNSGAAMSDVLPGTGAGFLPANCFVTVSNTDTTGILSIKPAAGAAFKTAIASTGFIYLCPGQSASFFSDGSNYWAIGLPIRCKLGGSTTIFIATGGSTTNDGLTSSTALPNTNVAYSLAQAAFDINYKPINFSHASGTYPCVLLNGGLLGTNTNPTNGSNVSFTGNAGTPTNVVISTTTCNNAWLMTNGATGLVNGFSLSNSQSHDFAADEGAIALIQNLNFALTGAGNNFITSSNASLIFITGNLSAVATSPNPGCAFIATTGAGIQTFNTSATVVFTLTGTFNFNTAFACTQYYSNIIINTPMTFTIGTITGVRYSLSNGAVINTAGGGSNYFPGSSAGTGAGSTAVGTYQ